MNWMNERVIWKKFSHDKLVQILSDQKCSSHKTGLGFDKFAASSLHVVSTSKTLFVKSKNLIICLMLIVWINEKRSVCMIM
jgi:hypothetical protein